MKSTAHAHEAATSTVETLLTQHRKLVDALGVVLQTYYENSPKEHLLKALDELIECARNGFMKTATLKSDLGCSPEAMSLDSQEAILKQMSSLRQQVEHSGTSHFLPNLIFIDSWLTTHISDEMLSVLYRRLERSPDTIEPLIAFSESLH